VQHQLGRQHGNANALSRRSCGDGVPILPSTGGVGPGDDVGNEQRGVTSVIQPGAAETPGCRCRRPAWAEVSAAGPEVKAYHAQWSNLKFHNGVVHRRWQAPGWGTGLLQLLVPRLLCPQVLQLVQGAAGVGHFGKSKTLHCLHGQFYWPGCRQDMELHVQCCDLCTAKKGTTQRSHTPLQQYLVGAPMERVEVNILGLFPTTDSGNRYVLIAMEYLTKWLETYVVPDQMATTTAERLVEEMFAWFGVPAELHSDKGWNF